MYLDQVLISDPPPRFARTTEPRWLAHDLCWQRLMNHFDQVPSLDKFKDGLLWASWTSSDMGISPPERSRPVRTDDSLIAPGFPCDFLTEKGPSFESFKRSLDLGKAQIALPRRRRRRVNSMNGTASVCDPFRVLPLELRLEIAQYLSTVDFLSLRFSSRAMAPLFDSQQFWRTRFRLYGERGFLNFLTKEDYKDWRLMYRSTHQIYAKNVVMSNWKDQWHQNEMIRDMCLINEAPGLLPAGKETRTQDLRYKLSTLKSFVCAPLSVAGLYIQLRFKGTENRCFRCSEPKHSRTSHTIIVPRRVLKIVVSVLNSYRRPYVTGLDFVHGCDQQITSFGYRVPGKQATVDLCDGSLRGFDVAFSLEGIHAIRAVTTNSDSILDKNWAGDLEDLFYSPSFQRLDAKSDIVTLSGEFLVSH